MITNDGSKRNKYYQAIDQFWLTSHLGKTELILYTVLNTFI